MTADRARVPWEIEDAAEALEGVSDAALGESLSYALDQVYLLRGMFAWAATELERALAYKGFSAYRRPFGETQVGLLIRAASGDAHGVIFDRQSRRVEMAARREDLDLPHRFTVPMLTSTGKVNDPNLRLAVAYAHRELFELRQLAAYEAGVARVHDIPSGPKSVRTILESVDRTLLASSKSPSAVGVGGFDIKMWLTRVGAPNVLTRSSWEKEHGIG